MNKLVQTYVAQEEKKFLLRQKQMRDEVIIGCGLTEKEYSDSSWGSDEYRNYDKEQKKYYKYVALELNDEEYEKVVQASQINNEIEIEITNEYKFILKLFTFSPIAIFIAGLICGVYYYDDSFHIALAIWTISVFLGLLILGIGSIIHQLYSINSK